MTSGTLVVPASNEDRTLIKLEVFHSPNSVLPYKVTAIFRGEKGAIQRQNGFGSTYRAAYEMAIKGEQPPEPALPF